MSHQLQQTVGWITKTTTTQVDETPVYGYGLFISNPPGDANCFVISGEVTVQRERVVQRQLLPERQREPHSGRGHGQQVHRLHRRELPRNEQLEHRDVLPSSSHRPTSSGSARNRTRFETCSDSANSNVYAYPPYLTGSSPLQKPDVNAQQVYTYGTGLGVPGDPTVNWNAPTCSTGSFIFDNNTTMDDESLANDALQRIELQLLGQGQCGGNTVGTLAWDNATKTLTVNGTIFIDGDITLAERNGQLQGQRDDLRQRLAQRRMRTSPEPASADPRDIGPGERLPGPVELPDDDPPAAGTGTLEFVFINPHNVSTPVNLQGSGHEWQVTLFVVKGFTSNGGTAILGPVLADGGSMAGNTGVTFPPIRRSAHRRRSLIPVTAAAWGVTPGNWKQLK